jgi:Domain of unknown function (DUF4136)
MKTRFLVVAWLLFVLSSVIYAQNIYIVSSSTAAFGHDRTYAWSRQTNHNPIAPSALAEEVGKQIDKELQNIGLSPVEEGPYQTSDVIVVVGGVASHQSQAIGTEVPLGSIGPEESAPCLDIELYDARTGELIWRGVAEHVLNKSQSPGNTKIVDRTIAEMFRKFPYHLNGWIYAHWEK